MQRFVDQDFSGWVVLAVDFDSTDQRFANRAMQAFNSAITATLKNNTYLELKGGRRLFLDGYRPPACGGLGAKFVFRRAAHGEPFATPEGGEVRFYSEFSKDLKLNMRFKLGDML